MGYSGRGWGIGIQTQPQVIVPSQSIIVTQPQQGSISQPPAPRAPERPPVPTPDDVAGMPGAELRGFLLYATDQLDEELDTISTGAGWKGFLRLDELRGLIPDPATAPPAPGTDGEVSDSLEPLLPEPARRQLAGILDRYDSAAQNSEYRVITNLWGFQSARVALRELLVPPIHRLRKQLSLSVELLEQELQQFETGSTWTTHLKLGELKRVAAIPAGELSVGGRRQLESSAKAFDGVAAQTRYRMISDLLGFRLTLHVTRSYLSQLKSPGPTAPTAPKLR